MKTNKYLAPESEVLRIGMLAPLASSIDWAGDYNKGTDDVTWSQETDDTWGTL